MNRLFTLLLAAAMSLAAHSQRYVTDTVRLESGVTRTCVTFLPAGLPPDAPLVVCMHGYGRTARPARFDLDSVAMREHFAVCYPQGLADSTGHTGFNVGYPAQATMPAGEVEQICALTRWVQRRYGLSSRNTFATGMSNGGDMCYLLAYSGQTTFRALAPVSGITMMWIYRQMQAPAPVPIYEIHGTADRTSLWQGDVLGVHGWGAYLPVSTSIGYWVARDRCTHELKPDTVPGLRPNGRVIVRHRWVDGTGGCQVWLDEVVGAPHSWMARDMHTGEAIWQFFRHYLK